MFFAGSYEDVKGQNDPHHAFLITSVHKTADASHGGIVFEISDSLEGRPFVNIGVDLLSGMKVKYTCIQEHVVFHGASALNGYDHYRIPTTPTSGSISPCVSSQGLISETISDLSSITNDDDGDDAEVARLNAKKPNWIGLEIPDGIDVHNMAVIT